ncbi:MAG: CHASE domain-containing protein [Leptospiraceae bacterium]|nr:CHASE domain-containing protein [Leptospiraceae bacterium]
MQEIKEQHSFQWFHWIVVLASLFLTFSAWYFSKIQIEEKSKLRFDRESSRVKELILERMSRYEDALWSGVSFIRINSEHQFFPKWKEYADNLKIDVKYPGINGIGVIRIIKPSNIKSFEKRFSKDIPGFKIFPEHDKNICMPIAMVIPIKGNEKAIGLDMAHEENRYNAAILSKNTGKATITGPIVLVQDKEKTPGFLFYAPYYENEDYNLPPEKRRFKGMVYAPFIIKKLMSGVLSKRARNVGIKISEGDKILYDEHDLSEIEYDENSLHIENSKLNLYGREWELEIRSTKSFRKSEENSQPLVILFGGIFIDLLLLTIFILLNRTTNKAVKYAVEMNKDLIQNQRKLEIALEEIVQFNYRASHDLVAPLKTTRGFLRLLKDDIKDGNTEELNLLIEKSEEQILRLEYLINSTLELGKADHIEEKLEEIDLKIEIENIIRGNKSQITENNIKVIIEIQENKILFFHKTRLNQILENLIINAIKYYDPKKNNHFIKISIFKEKNELLIIRVCDNGIGIDESEKIKVFKMFYRINTNVSYGSGLGLYLVKKHVERMGGELILNTEEDTCFILKLRIEKNENLP